MISLVFPGIPFFFFGPGSHAGSCIVLLSSSLMVSQSFLVFHDLEILERFTFLSAVPIPQIWLREHLWASSLNK